MTVQRFYVEYERKGNIVTIASNRPEKLNAVCDEVVRRPMGALQEFDANPAAHVAILCGRGRASCGGAGVHRRQLRTREELERLGPTRPWRQLGRCFDAIGELEPGDRRRARLRPRPWSWHGAGPPRSSPKPARSFI
jgi:enoyl-CoA hydratase/carnithine racemase